MTEDERRTRIKELHGFSEWAKELSLRRGFTANASLAARDVGELKGFQNWELVSTESLKTRRSACKGVRYLWKRPIQGREEIVLAQIIECSSVKEAHEQIIDLMMEATIPCFPKCEEQGLEVGDVSFCGYMGSPAGIIFARNNLAIDVRSIGRDQVSVLEVAQCIDRALSGDADSDIGPDGEGMRTRAMDLGVERSLKVRKGDRILLSVPGYRVADEKFTFRVRSTGGEIQRIGDDLFYIAESPGAQMADIAVFDSDRKKCAIVHYDWDVMA